MGYENPNVILIDSNGNTLPVQNGSVIPASTPSILISGSDGTNSRYIIVDSDGYQIIVGSGIAGTPSGGVVSIQGVSGGESVTISGSVTANIGTTNGLALDATLSKLTILQGAALGSNTQSLMGGSVTTSVPTYTNGNINPLSLTTSGLLRVDGSNVTQPVSGTGNFTVVQSTASNLNATVVGPAATGDILSGNPVRIAGSDGANVRNVSTDTSGRILVSGAAATGAAVTGNPVLIGGSDGANVRSIRTATDGSIRIDPIGTTAQPITDNGGSLTIDTTQLPAALVGGRLDSNIGSWLGSTVPTVGSKTSANSIPVVVASDQATITVNASATVGIVDNATFTDGTTRIQPVGYIFDETAGTALTENDGAAARIDSKRAQVHVIEDATTRGTRATVKAASTAAVAADTAFVVAISPNNIANVKEIRSSTASASSVAASASSVTLLSSNANRLGATIYNDSNQSLYVQFGVAASTTSFIVKLNKDDYYEVPFNYTGVINGIWTSASGSARVMELS